MAHWVKKHSLRCHAGGTCWEFILCGPRQKHSEGVSTHTTPGKTTLDEIRSYQQGDALLEALSCEAAGYWVLLAATPQEPDATEVALLTEVGF